MQKSLASVVVYSGIGLINTRIMERKLLLLRGTHHPLEYKLDVLNYMQNNGTSISETAAIFNIPSPSTILQWSRAFEEGGLDALEPKKKGRSFMKKEPKQNQPAEGTEEALRAEIERLRMENAYLKKLKALIQEKEKLQTKTKRK